MDNGTIDLRAILSVLLRRWRSIVLVTLAVAVVGLLGVAAIRPSYTAVAMVFVDPAVKNVLESGGSRGDASDNARVESEVIIARSGPVLEGIAQKVPLLEEPDFAPSTGLLERVMVALRLREAREYTDKQRMDAALGQLQRSVFVQRQGLTFVIAIGATASRPELASAIANAAAETYIDEQVRRKVRQTTSTRDAIASQVAGAQQAMVAADTELDAYISSQIDLISVQSGNTDLADIRRQILELTAAQARDAATGELISRGINDGDWALLARTVGDEALGTLNERREELERAVAGTIGDEVLDLRAELEDVQSRMAAISRAEAERLVSQSQSTSGALQDLRARQTQAIEGVAFPAESLADIYRLRQAAEIARRQYLDLMARSAELNTLSALQLADSSIVSRADPPSVPSAPNIRLFAVVIVLLALGVGMGVAFLREYFIGGLTSLEQMESVLGIRAVTMVPYQRDNKVRNAADLISTGPLTGFSESVRRLRMFIQQSIHRGRGDSKGAFVVMVASAESGEGKTVLSLALARSFAHFGKSVMLMDCDLRKPELHKILGFEPNDVLLKYLVGSDGVDLSSCMQEDPNSTALIVSGGMRSTIPTDKLFTDKAFERLIDTARRQFDIIVLDCPAILPVIDGLYIAGYADAIVLASRWGVTSPQAVKAAVNSLQESAKPGAGIFGVITQARDNPTTSPYHTG